jgi:hypothetical protein
VELNRAIIRKPDWESAEVRDGAEVEIVWFVGGGSTKVQSRDHRERSAEV